jgi:hypothetical protein
MLLTRKNEPWHWDPPQEAAFQKLKVIFTSPPILAQFDPERQTIIETNASDYAIAAVLSQTHEKTTRPIAFLSKKLSLAEQNYTIYKKKLLAIMTAFKHWAHYLRGARHRIEVLTDHRNLEYFKRVGTDRPQQARWAIKLEEFNYVIKFVKGKNNCKADALTRTTDPEKDDHLPDRVISNDHIIAAATQNSGFLDGIREGIKRGHHPTIEVQDCKEENGKIFYKGRE